MASNGICILCEQSASIEAKDHGNQKDILCGSGCPRYIVVLSAENKIQGKSDIQQAVLADVKNLSRSGKIVFIGTNAEDSIVCSIYHEKNV